MHLAGAVGLRPESAGVPCVVSCGASVPCNWRKVSRGQVLGARTGAREQDNPVVMGKRAPAHVFLCPQPFP